MLSLSLSLCLWLALSLPPDSLFLALSLSLLSGKHPADFVTCQRYTFPEAVDALFLKT